MVCRLKAEDSYSLWGEESLRRHAAAPCILLPADLPWTPGHQGCLSQVTGLLDLRSRVGLPGQSESPELFDLRWTAPVTLSLLAKPLVLDPSLQLLLHCIMFLPPNCTISPPSLGGWPWLLSHHTWPSCLLTHHKAPSPIPHFAFCLFWNIYHC